MTTVPGAQNPGRRRAARRSRDAGARAVRAVAVLAVLAVLAPGSAALAGTPSAPLSASGPAPGAGYPVDAAPPAWAVPPMPANQPVPGQFRPVGPTNARGLPPAGPPGPPGVYGPPGAARPPQPYPVAPGSALGSAPGPAAGAPPGWPGGYGPVAGPDPRFAAPVGVPAAGAARPWAPDWSGTAAQPPRLEWTLDDTRPYVQQTVLLRLRLRSSEALATADPEVAARGDVLLEQVAGPSTSTRDTPGSGRELVTEFVFALTPLSAGDLEVPAPRVNGTRAGSSARYTAAAPTPVRLSVRPPAAGVQPWLPLRSLSLDARLDRPERLVPGQPVTLALELSAVGSDAAALPSLEDELKSPDFRIYREQTLTESGLSPDGRAPTGRRTEYYTLIPQGGGALRLPELRVPWWNLDTDARQVALLPMRTVTVAGGVGAFRLPDSLTASTPGWDRVLLPVAGLLLVLAGYWAAVIWHRFPRVRRGARPAVSAAAPRDATRDVSGSAAEDAPGDSGPARRRSRLRRSWRRLAIRAAHGSRRLAAGLDAGLAAPVRRAWRDLPRLLPAGVRLRLCLRRAAGAPDANTWSRAFGDCAGALLGVAGSHGGARPADLILGAGPPADRARIAAHLARLERARYGREPLDLDAWKRDLRRLLRWRPGRRRPRPAECRLPPLNPRPL